MSDKSQNAQHVRYSEETTDTTVMVSLFAWRGYLMQRRRSLRTELAEIENILQQIAEQGIDKASI